MAKLVEKLPTFMDRKLARDTVPKVYAPDHAVDPDNIYPPGNHPSDLDNQLDHSPSTQFNPNLQRLEEHLIKIPLDVIGKEVLELTYGEMMDLADAIKKVDTDNVLEAISSDTIAQIMHRFGKSRVKTENEG
jgi:hypothetical protein